MNNIGNYNTGYRNTGDRNTGDWNTGDWNTGDRNTGDWNTGNYNTGYRNTGDRNTGDWNTGDWNTGDRNTGDWNTGNYNTGYRNTGDWNTGDWNTGYFNTVTPENILVFNKEVTREKWEKVIKPSFLYFKLTKWIGADEMTDIEKKEHDDWETTGGYLKKYEYKEAFQNSFNELSEDEKYEQIKLLKKLPNFDSEVFYEISGIDITKYEVKKMTLEEINKELGYKVEIIDR